MPFAAAFDETGWTAADLVDLWRHVAGEGGGTGRADGKRPIHKTADPTTAAGKAGKVVREWAGLELWPVLLDGPLPNWADVAWRAADAGMYVLRTDEPGGKPGPWIATVTPNPGLDVPSRERVAWLMASRASEVGSGAATSPGPAIGPRRWCRRPPARPPWRTAGCR